MANELAEHSSQISPSSNHVVGLESGNIDRQSILNFENVLASIPGATFGDSKQLPLIHKFAPGVYVREIFIPKGMTLTGKIHRHAHPNFLMQGEVLIVTEFGGREHLKAPKSMISKAGTKRVIHALEDTVWITVHVTPETDLKAIEEYVIAPTYEAFEEGKAKERLLTESQVSEKNCLILALKKLNRDFTALLSLDPVGILLPFKKAIEVLKESNVDLSDMESIQYPNGTYHVEVKKGSSLENLELRDEDLVGTWVGVAVGGGMAISGVGGIVGALNQPSGPAQINPQIQAELAARGIDINSYLANLQGQSTNFGEQMGQYGLGTQQALQNAYNQNYGGIEQGAQNFAQSAFAGKDPRYLTNQIASYGANVGTQRAGTDANIENMIAQSGIDPSSPYAQSLRSQAQLGLTNQYNMGVANMRNQSALSDLGMANNIMQTGMYSNRLAGAQLPGIPQTYGQTGQNAYNQAYNNYWSQRGVDPNSQNLGLAGKYLNAGAVAAGNRAQQSALANYSPSVNFPGQRSVGDWNTQSGTTIGAPQRKPLTGIW